MPMFADLLPAEPVATPPSQKYRTLLGEVARRGIHLDPDTGQLYYAPPLSQLHIPRPPGGWMTLKEDFDVQRN